MHMEMSWNFTDDMSARESVGKMADFETWTPLYLIKFKSNVYLVLQGLSYMVLSVPGKKFYSRSSSFFKLILLPTPCYGLEVM